MTVDIEQTMLDEATERVMDRAHERIRILGPHEAELARQFIDSPVAEEIIRAVLEEVAGHVH